MPEIFKFPIPEAYAEPINDGIKVTLIYPDEDKRQYTTERRLSDPADIEFGIICLEGLLRGDRVRIGTPEHPSRPASGGILDLFSDESFLTHRRDDGTKVHPWYNGIPSGFPGCRRHFDEIELLQRTKGAEESILFEREGSGIYVPNDPVGEVITRQRLAQLCLTKNRVVETPVEYEDGNDVLIIKDSTGNQISRVRGSIYLSWEVETNVAIAGKRYWPTRNPNEVAAIDAEGFMKEEYFHHLGREKFHIHPEEVANAPFDIQIPMPRRYRLERGQDDRGYAKLVPATAGEVYRFRPDDGLRRMLDACGFAGWKGKWIEHEIREAEKQYALLRGTQ
ncbi:MAG: hypothetical protein AABX82_03155 [Nanoarchaeota archaeon]